MHSDCGTKFVGASKLFETLDKFTQSTEHQKKCRGFLIAHNITWHFNPPSAIDLGGLWKAGVKSTKTLIHRTIGIHRLKYEELSTLLTSIEVTLNSWSLSALSPSPLDFNALTPSNFLTLMLSTANTLQFRSKWLTDQKNGTVDTLVIIRESTIPLCRKHGRITEVHIEQGGVVRVAIIRTATRFLKHPPVKLYPLPIC
ncbi:hypothetical protein QTP88_006935 [Uroleucon formosanum]